MHTGPLIMGITGDEQRMDAATISDTVNTAARIESLTKYYRSPLLLSGETLRQHNLREVETIMQVSARLCVGRAASRLMAASVDPLVDRLARVL